MPRCLLALWLLLSLTGTTWAEPIAVLPGRADQLCRPAIVMAERAHALPAGLLAAMGRVESGRRDPASGGSNPWPWTINAEGTGSFFDTKAEAIAAVRSLQARGVRSIDVGCLQVNLMHHPEAFASLEAAFDPAINADYAARFLTELYGQTNTWPQAVGRYHSATPDLGDAYQRQVMAIWPEEQRTPVAVGPTPLQRAWAATLSRPVLPAVGRPAMGQIIPLGGAAQPSPTGHSLDWYRITPVANRFSPRIGG